MADVEIETHVDGLGDLYTCHDSPFDEALEAILKKSDELITLRDLAYARIKEGDRFGSISQDITYVKEGSLFVPRAANKRIWLRNSLILDNPSAAAEAHRKGKEYLLPVSFSVDRYLEQISKDNYFILTDTTPVPTNRFGEDARMRWAFGDVAQQYGQLLADANIKNLHIYMWNDGNHIDIQFRPFANQLASYRLGFDAATGISGHENRLHRGYFNTVRGVHRETAEGGMQKK